jgi:hypothetical protein
MKALVKRYAEHGLWMEEVPMPQVGGMMYLSKSLKLLSAISTYTCTNGTSGSYRYRGEA